MFLRVSIICLLVFSCLGGSSPTYANNLDRCENILGIFQFYLEWDRLKEDQLNQIRELLKRDYPELPGLVARLDEKSAKAHNLAILKRLQSAKGNSKGISLAKAQLILDEVRNHPVASPANLEKYDPTGKVGLCFGRACAVHWAATENHEIPESEMRKIFLSGDLRASGAQWKFHTATMIRGGNPEGWWVIDPCLERPVMPSEWLKIWTTDLAWETNDSALLFVTSANQLVTDPHATVERMILDPKIAPFFQGLFESYPNRRPK